MYLPFHPSGKQLIYGKFHQNPPLKSHKRINPRIIFNPIMLFYNSKNLCPPINNYIYHVLLITDQTQTKKQPGLKQIHFSKYILLHNKNKTLSY
jgi:hypothetical protein